MFYFLSYFIFLDELGQKCRYLVFDNSTQCPTKDRSFNSTPTEMTCSYEDLVFDKRLKKFFESF
jgi:hypothetical protein